MESNSANITGSNVMGNVIQGDVAGSVSYIAPQQANQNIHESEQTKTLAEAAKEIQQLLKQLEVSNPSATEVEKVSYINDETSPSFKRRAAGALQASSEAAIESFLANPYINVAKAAIKGWIKPG